MTTSAQALPPNALTAMSEKLLPATAATHRGAVEQPDLAALFKGRPQIDARKNSVAKMPRTSGTECGTKAKSRAVPCSASVRRISPSCWWASILKAQRSLARVVWWVVSLGLAAEPDEPVTAETSTQVGP